MHGEGGNLRLAELRLKNFRNYSDFNLGSIGPLTAFVGPNAIGKTNILEAIHVVTTSSSFRSVKIDEMIEWGSQAARVEARIVSDARDVDAAVELHPGQKQCFLNGKKKPSQDLQGLLAAVVFSPDDLNLIKGANSLRRNALDQLGGQMSKNHRILRRDYDKIIRHKNTLLKENHPGALMDAVDAMVAMTGSQLLRYRMALARRLSDRLPEVYGRIAGTNELVGMAYEPSWACGDLPDEGEIEDCLLRTLHAARQEEIARGRCVVGPHADKVTLTVAGRDASAFASQGQQRSLVLAWKIAEVELITEITGTKPLLLLDDVMSELDARRRHALVDLLLQDIQTFITTTDASFFEPSILERARIIELPWGKGE